mmetsp:Transcript_17549/g.38353  ORF Transcript_17549/g.38353 Transcript_17549/m.38353 type:complete len:129 (-) Transcript_17549:1608-1994(-)
MVNAVYFAFDVFDERCNLEVRFRCRTGQPQIDHQALDGSFIFSSSINFPTSAIIGETFLTKSWTPRFDLSIKLSFTCCREIAVSTVKDDEQDATVELVTIELISELHILEDSRSDDSIISVFNWFRSK